VKQYYVVLRSIRRTRAEVRQWMTRCRACRIFFLTHPRNRGRRDLRCPFGCRDEHRKRRSTERSIEYYSTEEGKAKKKSQNRKRGQSERGPGEVVGRDEPEPEREGIRWDIGIVEYVRLRTSLIEGWPVSRQEILEMLSRAMRQHSIVRRRRMDYVLAYLKENAP
jgi:hypothetical protein